MMDKIKTWLQDEANLEYADVYFNSDKHLVIDTGDSNYTLSIVDEKTSTVGSEQAPATINFSADGDDNYEQTYSGFSEFFGLNNFFSNNMNDYILDSKIVNPKAAVGVNGVTTWNFSDSVNGLNYASIEISRTSTIQEIADKINNNDVLNERNIKASLIKNGEGYMLRIESLEGAQLAICEQGTTGVLDKLNMKVSSCGYASNISVREDIVQNVNLIACGSPQYDSNKGVYSINSASNNIANKMAATMSSDHTFKQAGNMATTTTTIANYASTFVGNVSSLANTAESSFEYQNALTSAISDKEAKFSGIDLDEELAQMIIYQQSYAACAQVFTASREILDTLLSMV
jgi:flagellar hook-associated protein 1 FlgK